MEDPQAPAPVITELLGLLKRHKARIAGTCQSGCYLEVMVQLEDGAITYHRLVGEFCGSIPEERP